MSFANERAFEDHLREIIESCITSETPWVYPLDNKTVGDIVILRDGDAPAIFFLEVKYYQPSKGRLGFGTGSGGGIQPEMLKRRPAYLDTHLRWAFGSGRHKGTYWLATSEEVCQFVSGGAVGEKQNNFQERLLREHQGVDRVELVHELKRWLLA